MNICSLSSGSSGNCYLIRNDDTALLIDAGLSAAYVSNALKAQGLTVGDLSGIVVSHEHTDHVGGIATLSKRVPIYAHPRIQASLDLRFGQHIETVDVDNYDGGFFVGSIYLKPFRTPHDAEYPLGYSLFCGGTKLTVATDTGCISPSMLKNMKDSNVVLLEANHDVDMLKNGRYPYPLKQRILGSNGHLSNDAAEELIYSVLGGKLHRVILGHLSEHNNRPDLAYASAIKALKRAGAKPTEDVAISVALAHCCSQTFEV